MASSTGSKARALRAAERWPPLDSDGHLLRLEDWSPEIARQLAADEGIALMDEHWRALKLVRSFHRRFHLAPAMRALISDARESGVTELDSSISWLRLFPGNPARLASRIAGLPRPHGCL